MKSLFGFLFIVFVLGCDDKEDIFSCANETLLFEKIEFRSDKICFVWEGTSSLLIILKNKKSGVTIEKMLDPSDPNSVTYANCIEERLDSLANYTLSVSKRCYVDGKYKPEFFKNYEFPSCQNGKVKNARIEMLLNEQHLLKFDKGNNDPSNFIVQVSSDGRSSFENYLTTNSVELWLLPGINHKIKITNLCLNGINMHRDGEVETINYYVDPILRSDVNSSQICTPINCDTSNLEPLLINSKSYPEIIRIPYIKGNAAECQLYYYQIASTVNPSVKTDLFFTIKKDNNGKYKVYYTNEYCGIRSELLKYDGPSTLKNSQFFVEFYEQSFIFYVPGSFILKGKQIY